MSHSVSKEIEYSWTKVLIWAFLFYLVWNWKSMILVYQEGVLPGPDDFMRLSQVQNWLMGQSWYDLKAHKIFPPLGADIHWTRFVDAPIGLLIGFLNLFMNSVSAERIAGIIWPFTLFMMTLTAMVSLCDRLAGKQHRLLVIFFFVMSMSTLAEFKPGRFDHHNIQILLMVLILLGVVGGLGRYSNYLIGVFASLSIVVGLDSLLLIISFLGYLALEWAVKRQGSAERLLQVGLAMGLSSIVFYIASFPPERWFSNNACDAFSVFYLLALVLLSSAFIALSVLSKTNVLANENSIPKRLLVGGLSVVVIVSLLFTLFPHCLDGPYGNVGLELKTRWLDKISEAKGLIENFHESPQRWISEGVYIIIMLIVMGVVLAKKRTTKPELLILGFIVLICVLVAFHQNRVLRTGLYAVIPFCVIFIAITGERISKQFKEKPVVIYSIQALSCLLLTSAFWFLISTFVGVNSSNIAANAVAVSNKSAEVEEDAPQVYCTGDASMTELNGLKKGHVLGDLNTSPSLLVHTVHTVEAASYHRNGEAILNVLSFFNGSLDQAEQIATKREVDYVVICRDGRLPLAKDAKPSMVNVIIANQIPNWLEWVSKPEAALAVLKVVR